MKYLISKNKFGFTFIEILVVITIIGILAAVAMVSYQSANIRSRDAKRKADIEQIRSALEMYRADYTFYPASLSSLTTTYIQTLPTPPKTTDCSTGSYTGCYTRGAVTTTYTISITLEAGGTHTVYNP